jgi:Flp pilus assembly CpaE family ATPase
MRKSEVEQALGVKMDFEVPSDRAVPLAVNRGVPAVLADGGSDFTRAVRTMSKGLLVRTVEHKSKRRMFALARS